MFEILSFILILILQNIVFILFFIGFGKWESDAVLLKLRSQALTALGEIRIMKDRKKEGNCL